TRSGTRVGPRRGGSGPHVAPIVVDAAHPPSAGFLLPDPTAVAVWSPGDVVRLRVEYRILGNLCGALPGATSQTKVRSRVVASVGLVAYMRARSHSPSTLQKSHTVSRRASHAAARGGRT